MKQMIHTISTDTLRRCQGLLRRGVEQPLRSTPHTASKTGIFLLVWTVGFFDMKLRRSPIMIWWMSLVAFLPGTHCFSLSQLPTNTRVFIANPSLSQVSKSSVVLPCQSLWGKAHCLLESSRSSAKALVACFMMADPNNPKSSTFDEVAYEKDRLEKDAKAMDDMKDIAESEFSKLRTPWKWVIRKRIWDLLEEKDIARFPRPVHHRIPNFVGADQAAARLATLDEFQQAKCVKVNPDTPQRPVRHLVLEQGKTLLTPQPRLRTGFFSTIQMGTLPSLVKVEDCTTSKGVVKYGTPVTLNDKYTVDLVVVGSTAVCPNTGARVGKGEGFAELEWGILSLQGNLDASKTLVVTTVHEEQIVTDMMEGDNSQLTKHDVPVDIIVTPKRIIRVPNRAPKPSGVFWDLLSPQKLAAIRVLRQLKKEIEERDQITLPSGPDEVLPPVASRKNKGKRKQKRNNNRKGRGARSNNARQKINKNESKKE